MKAIYVLGAIGWVLLAALPWGGFEIHPLVVSFLCLNMALSCARWASE
jgi:hypothetical protein